MERHFDEELKTLKHEIIHMSDLVKESIHNSVNALNNRSGKEAEAVINFDDKIDFIELDIDEKCIDLIAKHQPMAYDLRFITTGMRINAELERIADLSVNIAQRVLEIVEQPALKNFNDIPKLSNHAHNMINEAIKAFVDGDIQLAKKVVIADNEADKLRNFIQEELINDYLAKDASTAKQAVSLLLIARHLERICDHATNIAEDVIYMVQGKVVKHHFEELS